MLLFQGIKQFELLRENAPKDVMEKFTGILEIMEINRKRAESPCFQNATKCHHFRMRGVGKSAVCSKLAGLASEARFC